MKRIVTYILLALIPCCSYARENNRITYGAEWSYVESFFIGYHNNYFSPDGWRVNEIENDLDLCSNAEIYLHLGYNISSKWNVSVYAGYSGFYEEYHFIPISIRGTRFYKSNMKGDRWFSFADLGSGLNIKTQPQEIITAKLGFGYRICLSPKTRMDILAAFRTTYSHTHIYFDNTEIMLDRINRNNLYGCSLSLGISLSF